MSAITVEVQIEHSDFHIFKSLFEKYNIKMRTIKREDKISSDVKDLINIGIEQALKGDVIDSKMVHQKARELCMK